MKTKISTAIVFVPIDPKAGNLKAKLKKAAADLNQEIQESEMRKPTEDAPDWTWFIDNPRPNKLNQ